MGKEANAPGFDAVIRKQALVNVRTEGNAGRYAEHRRHLMGALAALGPRAGGRLCLIGAGNCNDVDLPVLAARFAEIHLVDLDRSAVARAINRQPGEIRSRLFAHAPVDAGGLLRAAESWRARLPTLAAIEAVIPAAVASIADDLPGPFDVAGSCCVLTQIGHGLTSILGAEHGTLADAHGAAATVHFRAMAALLAPGGQALFVTDLVSSDTYPLEELAAGRDLKAVVADLVRDANLFRGVNPIGLARILRRDSVLSRQAADVRAIEPWLWRAVPERTFLVNGFTFRRA